MVALGAPAPAVGLVPHLVRALEQARRLGGAVVALAAAEVLVEVLQGKTVSPQLSTRRQRSITITLALGLKT